MGMPSTTVTRLVGVLFILASATAIAGGSLLLPLREAYPPASTAPLVTGALLELTLAVFVVAIAALLAPVLRQASEGLAFLYVAMRSLEAALILVGAICALVLTTLAGSAARSALLTGREWAYHIGTVLVFGAGAVVLNAVLLRGRLVPRWLAWWGLLGGGLLLARGVVELYAFPLPGAVQAICAAPIGLEEMVFAGWLIVKGRLSPRAQFLPRMSRPARAT
ncbi:DUF4386 domain-containing protein [Paractinoplanes globisporus]|uniref:DUF4386 domain-containing protein n=1 Tax=Paractinoplanes globisporus TaxID=113565 RepID=A0ABW6WD29_9ACTN|nr:DUF4386 domain-containing protein [Actinoplanes globisporus]